MSVIRASNYRESKKILAVSARGDGPWVPVRRLRRIEVLDGGKEDVVRIMFRDHDLTTDPEPLYIRGSRIKETNFPSGQVRVERISGSKPLTIMAVCERLHDGSKTIGKRSVR